MGETKNSRLCLKFDNSIRLEFHGANVTSDAGLLAYRELDNAFGLTDKSVHSLYDYRPGNNTRHSIGALLRQSIFSRIAGYEDTNDAERLSVDPAMRQIVGGRAVEKNAASTSQMGRFETDILTTPENMSALSKLPGKWIDKVRKVLSRKKIVLDMDSSVSETYGNQEGSAYNGHFGCTCYHPLFCFNQFGDLEGAMLREGNVHSSKDWKTLLKSITDRYRSLNILRFFRGDAGFANPGIYKFLERRHYYYAIRLPANDIVQGKISHLLKRPVGRPPDKPIVLYHDFKYQAASWDRQRRVIAKVEWHRGELFPRVGFIVTNLGWNRKNVVRFYNKRGTAEQWIKEGKNAVKWTRLSCHDFVDNQVRLQLFALAYNMGNFLRTIALPESIKHWSMTNLREKLVKIGAKVVNHARYRIFQMAEVAISKDMFETIIRRIERFRLLTLSI
jgi:hypothetical protein